MSLSRFLPWTKATSPTELATQRLAAALVTMDVNVALVALANGADPNGVLEAPQVNKSRTFLQHALLNEHTPLFEALLTAGANPMASCEGCVWPAPHLATLHENREAIDALRAHPEVNFDLPVLDPMVGELSTARDIAARRGRTFGNWFGARFSLTEAARPPAFADEAEQGLARWREQRKTRVRPR